MGVEKVVAAWPRPGFPTDSTAIKNWIQDSSYLLFSKNIIISIEKAIYSKFPQLHRRCQKKLGPELDQERNSGGWCIPSQKYGDDKVQILGN